GIARRTRCPPAYDRRGAGTRYRPEMGGRRLDPQQRRISRHHAAGEVAQRKLTAFSSANENARLRGHLRALRIGVASAVAGVVPGNRSNFRPGNADVGKLAIIEAGEFAHALIVAPPRPDEPDKTRNQHGGILS